MKTRHDVLTYLWQHFAMTSSIEAKLDHFVKLLLKWQRKHNLISAHTIDDVWARHILDSASVLTLCPAADKALDIGSGGGLPAVVLAIFWQDQNPQAMTYLVEPIAKKTAFLRVVSRETHINTLVLQQRIEAIKPDNLPNFNIITSRALAPLKDLMGYSEPYFGQKTRAIFHKGKAFDAEIVECCDVLSHYDYKVHYPAEISDGVLLDIRRKGIVC